MAEQKEFKPATKNGYPLDEVTSALQKSIRRGLAEDAMYWALEMDESGYASYLWRRLVTIACEDIGDANPQLVQTVALLAGQVESMRKNTAGKSYDPVILGYVILSMARSPKSREADDFTNVVMRSRRLGERKEVPDYALDMHTERGRKLGRGPEFFWQEGAKLANEAHPSAYVGWDPELGDGTHKGKKGGPEPNGMVRKLF